MAYTDLIDEISQKLVTAGLKATPDLRDNDLSSASRGNFDGSFLLKSLQGGQPWVEAAPTPSHWRGELEIQIGTEITNSTTEAEKTCEERARLFFRTIVYANLNNGAVYEFSQPSITRNYQDKRYIWAVQIKIRWTDNT